MNITAEFNTNYGRGEADEFRVIVNDGTLFIEFMVKVLTQFAPIAAYSNVKYVKEENK